jgi:hypothetical protein
MAFFKLTNDFSFGTIGVVLAIGAELTVEPVEREQFCRDTRVFRENCIGMTQHVKRP